MKLKNREGLKILRRQGKSLLTRNSSRIKYLALVTDSSSPGSAVAGGKERKHHKCEAYFMPTTPIIWCHISKDRSCADVIAEN